MGCSTERTSQRCGVGGVYRGVDSFTIVETGGLMKTFYAASENHTEQPPTAGPLSIDMSSRARIAVYDAPAAAPRVEEIEPGPVADYIEAVSTRVYEIARALGGTIPYTVIREVSENLIHAGFREPVISVLDGGMTVRFADQGPGITDRERAVLPGFSTADSSMKHYIRGVGSGLPLVCDHLAFAGGSLLIEDNLGTGCVVTISIPTKEAALVTSASTPPSLTEVDSRWMPSGLLTGDPLVGTSLGSIAGPRLTNRQKQVLALVMESGSLGPSVASRELNIGISTAYRDLASLEDLGLIIADGGKRRLTDEGVRYLDGLISGLRSPEGN